MSIQSLTPKCKIDSIKNNVNTKSGNLIHEKKKIVGQRKARDLLSINEILKSCDIGLSTVIIEKKVITKTNTKFPKLVTKEDFVFWLKLLEKNYKKIQFGHFTKLVKNIKKDTKTIRIAPLRGASGMIFVIFE